MSHSGPIDRGHPAVLDGVVLRDTVNEQIIAAAVVAGVVRVKRQPLPVAKFDPVTREVGQRSLAREPKAVGLI
ncbi:MAG: hypothetical protein ACJ8F7_16320 [Gemmataceae bacterium]